MPQDEWRRNRFSASNRRRDLNKPTMNIPSECGSATIGGDHAMILPHNANPQPDGIFGKENRFYSRLTRASSCFVCQLKGTSIVCLYNRPHVHGDDLAVPNHNFAIDDSGSGLLRSAKEHCRHRVMQCTGITERMETEMEKVGAFTGI